MARIDRTRPAGAPRFDVRAEADRTARNPRTTIRWARASAPPGPDGCAEHD